VNLEFTKWEIFSFIKKHVGKYVDVMDARTNWGLKGIEIGSLSVSLAPREKQRTHLKLLIWDIQSITSHTPSSGA
jgi:hypothetical protein